MDPLKRTPNFSLTQILFANRWISLGIICLFRRVLQMLVDELDRTYLRTVAKIEIDATDQIL